MTQESVERVRRGYAAFSRGDLAAMVENFAPDFEWVTTGVLPDAEGVYRGPEEYIRFIESWRSEFANLQTEVRELIEAGDQVLASLTLRGRGKQSGAETSWDVWHVWTQRDGKAVELQAFTSRDLALEAAGLSE